MTNKCFICGKDIITNYEYHIIRKAVKPKGKPYRWKRIGVAHDECGDKYKTSFEYGENVCIKEEQK